jgi:uncharacterized protein (TIGR03435 family)
VISIGLRTQGDRILIGGFTFREYVALAYRVRPSQVVGPDWITGDRFELNAKRPDGTTADQIPDMMQMLLDVRFGLKTHRDKREMAVHALVVGKQPLRLTAAETASQPQSGGPANVAVSGSADGVVATLANGASYGYFPNGRFEGKKMTMAVLAATLERLVDRPVVDATSLTGPFDFLFNFPPEAYQPIIIRSAVNAGIPMAPQALRLMESAGSPIVDAIEQLGLKLDPRRMAIDVIVIDDARRLPTEN